MSTKKRILSILLAACLLIALSCSVLAAGSKQADDIPDASDTETKKDTSDVEETDAGNTDAGNTDNGNTGSDKKAEDDTLDDADADTKADDTAMVVTDEVTTDDLPEETASLIEDINSGDKTIQDIPEVYVINENGEEELFEIGDELVALSPMFDIDWDGEDMTGGATFRLTNDQINGPVGLIYYNPETEQWYYIDCDEAVPLSHYAVFTLPTLPVKAILVGQTESVSPKTGAGLLSLFN